MPLARIDLRRGKSPAYKKAICDAIYKAMTEAFNVPESDRFMIVNEHDADYFVHAERVIWVSPIATIWSSFRSRPTTRALSSKNKPSLPAPRNCLRKIRGCEWRTCSSISSSAKRKTGPSANGIAQYAATTS